MFHAQNNYNRDEDSLGATAAEPAAHNSAAGERRRDEGSTASGQDNVRPLSIRSLLNVSNNSSNNSSSNSSSNAPNGTNGSNGHYSAAPLSAGATSTHTQGLSLSPPEHRDYYFQPPDAARSSSSSNFYAPRSSSSHGVSADDNPRMAVPISPDKRTHAVGAAGPYAGQHRVPASHHHSSPVSAPSMFSYPHHPHHHAHPHLISARGMYHTGTP
ncbi:hypothetical protein LPJ53_002337, partial [Coemansia erecta]